MQYICNVNVNLYSAPSQKNNASNALNVPSTVKKEMSPMYSQFACPAHAETTGSPSWVSTENIMVDGLPPFQKIYNTAVLQATVNS